MNVFATDHPLNSKSEDKQPGLRSYLFGGLLVALIVGPFFAVGIWLLDVTDNGGSTGGFTPAPFWVDLLTAMAVSLFAAFAGACGLRLLVLPFRKFGRKRSNYAA